jgi:hypothetical protein
MPLTGVRHLPRAVVVRLVGRVYHLRVDKGTACRPFYILSVALPLHIILPEQGRTT